MRQLKRVVFLQRFGRRDLFTGVPPEQLTGWRRNVGLLVALLQERGVAWVERYTERLEEVTETADLFVLRDWRYPSAQVAGLRRRFPGVPVVAMLFQVPHHHLEAQRCGEERFLFGKTAARPAVEAEDAECGLFLADRVVVRSPLNRALFVECGHPAEKMVLLPHAPIWTCRQGRFHAVRFPRPASQDDGFHVLFVGDGPVRKGLFRLHDAFASLAIPGKRLHIYSPTLSEARAGSPADLPARAEGRLRALLADPAVTVHEPYRGLEGLSRVHAAASVLACPSLVDNGPNALVEGAQLGTLLLASDLCGAVGELPVEIETVAAPRWWLAGESGHGFTERIAQALLGCRRRACPEAVDLTPLLDSILDVWRGLLRDMGL